MANLLHDIRTSRGGPRVSHLLFADDYLLFSQANKKECSLCRILVFILRDYERASVQQVNFEKSEVSFSRGFRND